jgi:hypothetical protein
LLDGFGIAVKMPQNHYAPGRGIFAVRREQIIGIELEARPGISTPSMPEMLELFSIFLHTHFLLL